MINIFYLKRWLYVRVIKRTKMLKPLKRGKTKTNNPYIKKLIKNNLFCSFNPNLKRGSMDDKHPLPQTLIMCSSHQKSKKIETLKSHTHHQGRIRRWGGSLTSSLSTPLHPSLAKPKINVAITDKRKEISQWSTWCWGRRCQSLHRTWYRWPWNCHLEVVTNWGERKME